MKTKISRSTKILALSISICAAQPGFSQLSGSDFNHLQDVVSKSAKHQVENEDFESNDEVKSFRSGVAYYVHYTTANSGTWSTTEDGYRKWQLTLDYPGAEALTFIFSQFKLSKTAIFYVKGMDGMLLSKVFTAKDMLEDGQQIVPLCEGKKMVLTLVDRKNVSGNHLNLERVIYHSSNSDNPDEQPREKKGSVETSHKEVINQSGLDVLTVTINASSEFGKLNVQLENATEEFYAVQLIDSKGIVVKHDVITPAGNQFSIEYLTAGMYMLQIKGTTQTATTKIAIQK